MKKEAAPGGRNMELANCGPWRETSTPVRAIAARKDWNGAPAIGIAEEHSCGHDLESTCESQAWAF